MERKRFKLSHSLVGMAALLLGEGALLWFMGRSFGYAPFRWMVIFAVASFGGAGSVVLATEVIREVRNAMHMLVLLSAIVFEFILYFAFQYWYLALAVPGSFAGLQTDAVSILLHSTMIFVFNPLYQPVTLAARTLMLANTLEALALVLFILQNVSQFRATREAPERT